MVLTFDQEKELLEMKQKHQRKLALVQGIIAKDEHQRKLLRLDKLLEIAKAGGIGYIEK